VALRTTEPADDRPDSGPDRQSAQQSVQSGYPAASSAGDLVVTRKASLLSAFRRLTGFGFPQRFPIVQFPNLPLIVAFVAGQAGAFLHGTEHSYAASVSYLAMTIWAYEELVHGVNWFRRVLGLTFVILLIMRVARAVHP
jgi:hypothetical protein